MYWPLARNNDAYCQPIKSNTRCDPCQMPSFAFADDCSLCDGTRSVPVVLCRSPIPVPGDDTGWPIGKPVPKKTPIDTVYCDKAANTATLAALLVHEASHSCVGTHTGFCLTPSMLAGVQTLV